jgi:hypothetical protein
MVKQLLARYIPWISHEIICLTRYRLFTWLRSHAHENALKAGARQHACGCPYARTYPRLQPRIQNNDLRVLTARHTCG